MKRVRSTRVGQGLEVGLYCSAMPTVLKRNGFRFVINTDDHEPAHVHVYKAGKVVLINLGGEGVKPYVRKVRGMRKSDVKKAVVIAGDYQLYLLDQWEAIHGSD